MRYNTVMRACAAKSQEVPDNEFDGKPEGPISNEKIPERGLSKTAKKLYEEALSMGLNEPRYILSYTVLLLRNGEYQKSRELLVANQNNPMLNAESKRQLFVNYSVCVYKLGEIDKALRIFGGAAR